MREVAERFDQMIRELLETRRTAPAKDVTGELLGDRVDGRQLTTEEIVSNCATGPRETSVTRYLGRCPRPFPTGGAEHPEVVRRLVDARDSADLVAAIEEILRIDDPFVANRRVATCAVRPGGENIAEGDQVLLNWTAANRDPLVFEDLAASHRGKCRIQPGVRDRAACLSRPGADADGLRAMLEELLGRTTWVELAQDQPAVREAPPVGGWARPCRAALVPHSWVCAVQFGCSCCTAPRPSEGSDVSLSAFPQVRGLLWSRVEASCVLSRNEKVIGSISDRRLSV